MRVNTDYEFSSIAGHASHLLWKRRTITAPHSPSSRRLPRLRHLQQLDVLHVVVVDLHKICVVLIGLVLGDDSLLIHDVLQGVVVAIGVAANGVLHDLSASDRLEEEGACSKDASD